ncbi:hypothetical protein BY458DRAFT_493739 [Sporodiniella umbellata]|nr:hypothetical protein BY458DRAFT_493739 [Sporodiniella umbellata]
MNNTVEYRPEGSKKYSSTTNAVSTDMLLLQTNASPFPLKSLGENSNSNNEGFSSMSPAFIFDQQLYGNNLEENAQDKVVASNANNFDPSLSVQNVPSNQLDGFLLNQLTQNDMDILLSLSIVPETENTNVLQTSTFYQSNRNTAENGSISNELFNHKSLFEPQDDGAYFDQDFLENASKLLIESPPDPTHRLLPEANQGEYRVCLWTNCGHVFPDLQMLITHLSEVHMGKGKATYRCEWEGCPRIMNPFTKRHKMYAHLRIHTGERPFICPHPGCQKQFTRPDSLTNHIKTHSKIKTFVCSWEGCDKAYFYSRSLKKHEGTHISPKSEKSEYQASSTKPNTIPEVIHPLFVPVYQNIVEFTNGHYNYLA